MNICTVYLLLIFSFLQLVASEVNLYKILDVDRSASQKDIKRAYRRAAVKYHPDKAKSGQEEQFQEKFIQITKAYEILGDKEKRARYDQLGAGGFDGMGNAKDSGPDNSNFHEEHKAQHEKAHFRHEHFHSSTGSGGFQFKHSDFFDDFMKKHNEAFEKAHGHAPGGNFQKVHADAMKRHEELVRNAQKRHAANHHMHNAHTVHSARKAASTQSGKNCVTKTTKVGNTETTTTTCT